MYNFYGCDTLSFHLISPSIFVEVLFTHFLDFQRTLTHSLTLSHYLTRSNRPTLTHSYIYTGHSYTPKRTCTIIPDTLIYTYAHSRTCIHTLAHLSRSLKLTNRLTTHVIIPNTSLFKHYAGIALVGNPEFAIVDEAYPFISRRLMTDDSPRLRAALRFMIYGKGTTLDVDRVIDMLQALEKFVAVKDLGDGSAFKVSLRRDYECFLELVFSESRLQQKGNDRYKYETSF